MEISSGARRGLSADDYETFRNVTNDLDRARITGNAAEYGGTSRGLYESRRDELKGEVSALEGQARKAPTAVARELAKKKLARAKEELAAVEEKIKTGETCRRSRAEART